MVLQQLFTVDAERTSILLGERGPVTAMVMLWFIFCFSLGACAGLLIAGVCFNASEAGRPFSLGDTGSGPPFPLVGVF
jgi:hypothetical protein